MFLSHTTFLLPVPYVARDKELLSASFWKLTSSPIIWFLPTTLDLKGRKLPEFGKLVLCRQPEWNPGSLQSKCVLYPVHIVYLKQKIRRTRKQNHFQWHLPTGLPCAWTILSGRDQQNQSSEIFSRDKGMVLGVR